MFLSCSTLIDIRGQIVTEPWNQILMSNIPVSQSRSHWVWGREKFYYQNGSLVKFKQMKKHIPGLQITCSFRQLLIKKKPENCFLFPLIGYNLPSHFHSPPTDLRLQKFWKTLSQSIMCGPRNTLFGRHAC